MKMHFAARPEIELLLCCARTKIGPETRKRIHALARRSLDWEYLVTTALRHLAMPLLYQGVKRVCPETVPHDILERLRNYFLANAARNLFLSGQLLHLLDLFQDHGLPVIPFKGPVLAETVYGDVALRQFCDLDILVHRHNAWEANEILVSRGFQPEVHLTHAQNRKYVRTEYSLAAVRDNDRIMVDMHWEMTGRYTTVPFDLPLLEDRLEPTTFQGKRISQPSAEDLLFYQCLHGTKHRWAYLDCVCSVAELIRSRLDMDWIYISRLARKMRCQRMLSLGLLLAHGLLGAPLPAPVLERAKADSAVRGIATKICKTLFHERSRTSQKLVSSDFSSFHLKVRDQFSDSLRYGASLVFQPSRQEWRYFPLPPALAFLHYLLRPIRLTVGLALTLIRRKVAALQRLVDFDGSESATGQIGAS